MSNQRILRIGTRKSRLALGQTDLVAKRIKEHFPDVLLQIVPMSTGGDERQNASLADLGGKGAFTRELELALLDGVIDMAVHSAKDMPLLMPKALTLSPILEREHPGDYIIKREDILLSALPEGTRVGTSSLRRRIQLLSANRRLCIEEIRGNVQTRLKKLARGEYDAIVLAGAGIRRLNSCLSGDVCSGFFCERLPLDTFLPAPGQGILALETRKGELEDLIEILSDEDTVLSFHAERAFLRETDAGCNAPFAAVCLPLDGGRVSLRAMFAPDYRHPRYRRLTVKKEEAQGAMIGLAKEIQGEMADCGGSKIRGKERDFREFAGM